MREPLRSPLAFLHTGTPRVAVALLARAVGALVARAVGALVARAPGALVARASGALVALSPGALLACCFSLLSRRAAVQGENSLN